LISEIRSLEVISIQLGVEIQFLEAIWIEFKVLGSDTDTIKSITGLGGL
jgi:hypothetical protein